jgi:ribosomal protein S18 acetylase RimI-like enzyme
MVMSVESASSSNVVAASSVANNTRKLQYLRLLPPVGRAGVPLPSPATRWCCCRPCRRYHEGVGVDDRPSGSRRSKLPEPRQWSDGDSLPIIHFDAYDDGDISSEFDSCDVPYNDATGSTTANDQPQSRRALQPPTSRYPLLDSMDTSARNHLLLTQLRALHSHLFPVPYDDDFFEVSLSDPACIVILGFDVDASSEFVPFLPPIENGEMLGIALSPADFERSEAHRAQRRGFALGHTFPEMDPRPSPFEGGLEDARRQLIAVALVRVRPVPAKVGVRAPGAREGYIATLGVRKDARGDRLASTVLKVVVQESFQWHPETGATAAAAHPRCERLWLHCLVGNYPALSLYARHGFRTCDFLAKFYTIHGVDCDANVLALAHPAHTATVPRAALALYHAETFALDPDKAESACSDYPTLSDAERDTAHLVVGIVGSVLVAAVALAFVSRAGAADRRVANAASRLLG